MKKVICDLDGVVFAGNEMLPGSTEAIDRLVTGGVELWFATNNSTLSPRQIVSKLRQLSGVTVDASRVVTSVLAAASQIEGPVGSALVIGGQGIVEGLEESGIRITSDPKSADLVLVGLDQQVTYGDIAAAAMAVREGAQFIATNDDPTLPTPKGELPGTGAIVAAISTAAGVEPIVAGKPYDPMVQHLLGLVGPEAWVIGDRVSTDVAMAGKVPGWQSVLTLGGVTRAEDDHGMADHVVKDLLEATDLILDPRYGNNRGYGAE